MTYRNLVCGVIAAMLVSTALSAAREMPALQTAPPGGQLVSNAIARVVVPEGWSWAQRRGVIAASPNVPAGFFRLEDPKLTDDMATCIDLSREENQAGMTQESLSESVNRIYSRTKADIAAVGDAAARAAAFAELRTISGGGQMMVAVIPDDASQFGVDFTGDVYAETRKSTIHLVCKATFSSDKGPYAERQAMKAMLQLLNSFTPL